MKTYTPIIALAVGAIMALAGCATPSPEQDTRLPGTTPGAGDGPAGGGSASGTGAVPCLDDDADEAEEESAEDEEKEEADDSDEVECEDADLCAEEEDEDEDEAEDEEDANETEDADEAGDEDLVDCEDADEEDEDDGVSIPVAPANFAESRAACTFETTGSNAHFPLEVGANASFLGEDEDGDPSVITVEVTDQTRVIDGVTTRLVTERETVEGDIEEVSRRYYAVCKETGTVYIFGEEVDAYDDEELDEQTAWFAGVDGMAAGVAMPGTVALGTSFFEEIQDGVGVERAEIVAVDETVTTSAGTFTGAIKVAETESDESGTVFKWYAPGVGLVLDEEFGLASSAGAPTFEESVDACTFASTGRNPYFILEPGYRLVFEGIDDGEPIRIVKTVTTDTKVVDGVTTRVLVEEEYEDGELIERSWNWFAYCEETGSVFYFGEDVDIYEDGTLESHEGAWEAGVDGAEAGVIMPGSPTVGMKHFQEQAPGVALDYAEILAMDETVVTPAGTFTNAMKVKETTSLEPDDISYKWYAADVGLLVDGQARLVEYGTG